MLKRWLYKKLAKLGFSVYLDRYAFARENIMITYDVQKQTPHQTIRKVICVPLSALKNEKPDIRLSWVDSPWGEALIAALVDKGLLVGICAIGFVCELNQEQVLSDMKRRWPHASFLVDDALLFPLIEGIFSPQKYADIPLVLIGTPFQHDVWLELLEIPFGETKTYSEIAQAVGRAAAVRATASAIGQNPISLIVPCHRVLRKGGALGGYHWGLELKQKILAYESAQS